VQCSSKCSNGKQIRKVFCGSLVGESIKKVDNVKCDPSKKYEDTKNCTGKETCKGEWFSGPWTAVCLNNKYLTILSNYLCY